MEGPHRAGKSIPIQALFLSLILFDAVAIFVAIVLGVRRGNPLIHFDEHRFITWISVLQLLTVSILSYNIFKTRRWTPGHLNWRAPYALWAIISVGFFFLAMDDLFRIHESIDHRIHDLFNLRETAVSTRIDDIIVGVYGLIGIASLYWCREEIKKYRQIFPFLIYGFVLLFIMVALDILTHSGDILRTLVRRDLVAPLQIYLSVAEDSVKIFGSSFFLVGFYGALQMSKRWKTKPGN